MLKLDRMEKWLPLFFAMVIVVMIFCYAMSAFAQSTRIHICHRLGNGGYNEITIDDDALPAHLAHGDIYPVPEGGCPGPPTSSTTTTQPIIVVGPPTTLGPPRPAQPPRPTNISPQTVG